MPKENNRPYIERFLNKYKDRNGNIPARPKNLDTESIREYMEKVRRGESAYLQQIANMRFR